MIVLVMGYVLISLVLVMLFCLMLGYVLFVSVWLLLFVVVMNLVFWVRRLFIGVVICVRRRMLVCYFGWLLVLLLLLLVLLFLLLVCCLVLVRNSCWVLLVLVWVGGCLNNGCKKGRFMFRGLLRRVLEDVCFIGVGIGFLLYMCNWVWLFMVFMGYMIWGWRLYCWDW